MYETRDPNAEQIPRYLENLYLLSILVFVHSGPEYTTVNTINNYCYFLLKILVKKKETKILGK